MSPEAIGGITEGANQAMGLVTSNIQNKRLRKNTRDFTAMQLEANKEMSNYNAMKNLELWQKTNYGAQRSQLENAGLNVGLLYGMSGGGGTVSDVPQGNVNAPDGHSDQKNVPIGMGMALAKEMEMKDALIDKTKAEAENLRGVDRSLKGAQTADLLQGVENKKAQQRLTEVETTLKSIDASFAGESYDDRLETIRYGARKSMYEVNLARNESNMSDELYNTKVEIVKRDLINKVLESANIEAKTNLTKQQIDESVERILKMQKDVELKGEEVDIKEFEAELKALYPSMSEAMGNMSDQTIRTLRIILQGGENREARRNVDFRNKN